MPALPLLPLLLLLAGLRPRGGGVTGVSFAASAKAGSRLRRRGGDDEPDVSATAWTPPPSYFVSSMDHKTMYLVDVTIGSAGQTFRLLVDTGSSVVVVPSAACSSRACTQHRRLSSKSARDVGQTLSITMGRGELRGHLLEDKICVQASQGTAALSAVGFLQRHQATRRAGARRRGMFESENVTSEATSESTDGLPCARMPLLAADEESDDLAQLPFDGILGLGLEDSRTKGAGLSFMDGLAKSGSIRGSAFTLRLGAEGESQLTLGSVDEGALAGGQLLWVPLSPWADGYWQFSAADFSINGELQNFGPLEVSVDSGTSLLAADDNIRHWFQDRVQPKDCSVVDSLPVLGLRLNDGNTLPFLPSDYIDQLQGGCQLSLMPSKFQSVNAQRLILGDSFLRRFTTVFDRENRRIGFGVSRDDSMAHELLPAMFTTTTTTEPPTTTPGPPPALHLKYEDFAPETTPPPPSPEEVQDRELNAAFSKLPQDISDDFDKMREQEKASLRTQAQAGPSVGATGRRLVSALASGATVRGGQEDFQEEPSLSADSSVASLSSPSEAGWSPSEPALLGLGAVAGDEAAS